MYVKKNYIKLSAEFNLSRVRNTNQMQARGRAHAGRHLNFSGRLPRFITRRAAIFKPVAPLSPDTLILPPK